MALIVGAIIAIVSGHAGFMHHPPVEEAAGVSTDDLPLRRDPARATRRSLIARARLEAARTEGEHHRIARNYSRHLSVRTLRLDSRKPVRRFPFALNLATLRGLSHDGLYGGLDPFFSKNTPSYPTCGQPLGPQ